jgi:predicted nucleic acid-binding protein
METAVLDACVLFKGNLTNLLLWLAESGAFAPVWSTEIRDEWMRSLEASGKLPPDKIAYRAAEMENAFPGASLVAPESLRAEVLALCRTEAQRHDAHVIATAIAAEATIIVTDNVQDFADEILDRYDMRAMTPDAFCRELYRTRRDEFLAGVRAHRESMRRPLTPDEYVAALTDARFALPKTAALLDAHRSTL